MPFPNDGLASHIASPAGGWNPQVQPAGVLQLTLPASVTSGTMDTIMLAVKTVSMPAREIQFARISYLAGYSNVAVKQAEPGDMTVTVHDYVDVNVYQVFHDWSQAVFDQSTGFIGSASAYKTNGMFLLFGPAPQGETPTIQRRWELSGIALKTQIPERIIDYTAADVVTLNYTFAVDDYQYLGVR